MKRITLTVLSLSIPGALANAQDWAQWRGPQGNGVSQEKNLPLTWDKDKGIAWRARLSGPVSYTHLTLPTKRIV